MGREIEIKIPLTSEEFDRIYDFLCLKKSIDGIKILGDDKNPRERKFFLKKDEYFSKYKKEIIEEYESDTENQYVTIPVLEAVDIVQDVADEL